MSSFTCPEQGDRDCHKTDRTHSSPLGPPGVQGIEPKAFDSSARIACGGASLHPLPVGATCAGRARTLLRSTMRDLGLPEELTEDGALMVSELATNSHLHTAPDDPLAGGAELWIWGRTLPCPQLVVTVFDTDRAAVPRVGPADLLDEYGKGLAIVENLATAWGAHPSRGRLAPGPRAGKCVWFALPLPGPWPWTLRVVSPSLASKRLVELLRVRGIEANRICDDKGISLITAGHLNIWVEPRSFAWRDGIGGHTRHPHLDLQDTVEQIIATIERAAIASASPPVPAPDEQPPAASRTRPPRHLRP